MSGSRTARTRPEQNGPKHRAKRDRILDVAVAAFRRRGYAGTSIEDISRELHLTKGSLYHYFRDKEDILFSCHERALDHLLAVTRAVRRAHLEPEAALRELIHQHARIMVEEFRGTALALEVGALTGPRLRRVVGRRDEYEGTLRGLIEGGIRSGAFRPVDPKLSAFAILGAINWMARWYRAHGGASPDEVGRFFADLHLRALKRSGGGPTRRGAAARRPARAGRPARAPRPKPLVRSRS